MRHSSAMTTAPPTWGEAWHEALYGADGFYRRSAPADHFTTSAQGIPGGGRVLARAIAGLARSHRCTRVVDLGCGRGELLTHLRDVAPHLHLTGVDIVPRPPDLDVDDWLVSPGGADLPDELRDLEETLVLAHEWLDVVPCPVVETDDNGIWRVVTVARDGTEEHGRWLTGDDLRWVKNFAPQGATRLEVGRARDLAWQGLLDRIRTGAAVAVDYGNLRRDRPRHGTLTGYRDGRQVEPVPDGSCDLTAHVAFDSLISDHPEHVTIELMAQRDWLFSILGQPTGPVPHELATTDPTAYLDALAERAALNALTAWPGLGEFWWAVAHVAYVARVGG